jgi:hypothetical protein
MRAIDHPDVEYYPEKGYRYSNSLFIVTVATTIPFKSFIVSSCFFISDRFWFDVYSIATLMIHWLSETKLS